MKVTTIKQDTAIALEGGVVSIYEDDVELAGAGYENMVVFENTTLSVQEFQEEFELKKKDKRTYDNGKKEWKHNGKWYEIKKEPKYEKNMKGVDKDLFKLATNSQAKGMLKDHLKDTVEMYPENLTTESIE